MFPSWEETALLLIPGRCEMWGRWFREEGSKSLQMGEEVRSEKRKKMSASSEGAPRRVCEK